MRGKKERDRVWKFIIHGDRQLDRQKDRMKDSQIDRQIDIQLDRMKDRWIKKIDG